MAARYQSLQRDKPRAADFQEDRRMQPGPGRSEVAEDYGAVAQVPARVAFRRAGRMSVGRAQLLIVLEMTLEPLVLVLRWIAPPVRALEGGRKRAVLAGMNEPGVELARRLNADRYSSIHVVGFVDDRARDRLTGSDDFSGLCSIQEMPEFVKKNRIELVYLALPMASQPRILSLLESLRDTTASVYFVPDMFVTDLIQGRIDSVSGMPIVGVCDTPFSGVDGLVKRGSDIVLALLILALTSPLLLLLALAVKLTTPGPAIFRQRRYGLDGEEIVVYKFRTMTVTEDGDTIRQCRKADERVTPLGAFMRRTSLDELPQFINVVQGRMKIGR